MYGVVLWSNTEEKKAVIWCEDHGDLAYYRQSGSDGPVSLDAGDWVQFDLTLDRHMRFAHNPRLVAEGVCSGLADSLIASGAQTGPQPISTPIAHGRGSAEVIPFAAGPARQGLRHRDAAVQRA